MASRKVDVKAQRQRAGHQDLIFVQLGHVDIQSLAWVGFRGVKVMRLTERGAFMAFFVFSLCVERRLSGTDIVFKKQKFIFN